MMGPGLAEHTDHARQGGVDPSAHVERFHSEPGRIDADHFKTSRSQIAHSCIAELGHCTLTVKAPRRTSILIGVLPAGFACTGTAINASLGKGSALGAVTASDRSASTTHRRSRLALIARAIAAAAIDTPGCRQADTASALNAAL